MTYDELNGKYAQLRNQLAEAYADPDWDSGRISHIADAMVPIEQALATLAGCISAAESRIDG
ncbi:MAG: hypothetical protein M3Z16_08410 [Pseudomonadota bacterium]|nr:hypothetical protein [Pseudomonadota bacterium]